MEYWTSPEVVARFRWRVKAYRITLAIAWCAVPLFVMGLFSAFGIPAALYLVAAIAFPVIGLAVMSAFWRCSNCRAGLNPHRETPDGTVSCDECGAVLYEPDGRYDAPSPPRTRVSSSNHRDDVDAMAEAEIYLDYGRKAQAIEVLQAALQDNPTRADIACKLAGLRGQPAGKR